MIYQNHSWMCQVQLFLCTHLILQTTVFWQVSVVIRFLILFIYFKLQLMLMFLYSLIKELSLWLLVTIGKRCRQLDTVPIVSDATLHYSIFNPKQSTNYLHLTTTALSAH